MGYYNNPEKTAAAMRDGWYHTGDTAWCDEDGYFWYVAATTMSSSRTGIALGLLKSRASCSTTKRCANAR